MPVLDAVETSCRVGSGEGLRRRKTYSNQQQVTTKQSLGPCFLLLRITYGFTTVGTKVLGSRYRTARLAHEAELEQLHVDGHADMLRVSQPASTPTMYVSTTRGVSQVATQHKHAPASSFLKTTHTHNTQEVKTTLA